ncbi:MAG TPA: hypothetical protein VN814_07390 [Caulobacteraceae bacterium]|nr:hypothetical protein [Caulobacteraceae bacterium]
MANFNAFPSVFDRNRGTTALRRNILMLRRKMPLARLVRAG